MIHKLIKEAYLKGYAKGEKCDFIKPKGAKESMANLYADEMVENLTMPDASGSFLESLAKPSFEDLQKVGGIREKIEGLIHGSDMHEDIIESLLKPFEDLLKHNGVNLNEIDC